jgi:amylosucrase
MSKWVWTTFNSYQWDLNYSNPAVFLQMMGEMVFLAELGIEVLRFDAPAFIWKKTGTGCENLPEVHILIQAFKSIMSVTAPGVLFLSEAIVHPDEIEKYISVDECELSYNPLLMATLWESLATRKTRLLKKSMEKYSSLPKGCYWINYIRCHDDIGWTFSDQVAWTFGIDPTGHRKFLNNFFTGKFEGSFAKGLPFQENLRTGDLRISGTLASLAGIEKALAEETEIELDLAIKRILLLYGIIFSMSGYPLIYMGDEAGQLNNYTYTENQEYKDDSRWVHRLPATFPNINADHYSSRIFNGLKKLVQHRKKCPAFSGNTVRFLNPGNEHVFGFIRENGIKGKVTIVSNFSEQNQIFKMPCATRDLLSGDDFDVEVELEPYRFLWLEDRRS